MEPRKAELEKTPVERKDKGKSRFQIVKLEERIAPCGGFYIYRGRKYHYHYRGPCGGHK